MTSLCCIMIPGEIRKLSWDAQYENLRKTKKHSRMLCHTVTDAVTISVLNFTITSFNQSVSIAKMVWANPISSYITSCDRSHSVRRTKSGNELSWLNFFFIQLINFLFAFAAQTTRSFLWFFRMTFVVVASSARWSVSTFLSLFLLEKIQLFFYLDWLCRRAQREF